jgi:hypothetical protein
LKIFFGLEIPQSSSEDEFSTGLLDSSFTLAMYKSQLDNHNSHLPSQAILLDGINLESPQLLEFIDVLKFNMNTCSCYFLPNGK